MWIVYRQVRLQENARVGERRGERSRTWRQDLIPSKKLAPILAAIRKGKATPLPRTTIRICPARVPRSKWSGDVGGGGASSWAQAAIGQSFERSVASSGPTVGHGGAGPWTMLYCPQEPSNGSYIQ